MPEEFGLWRELRRETSDDVNNTAKKLEVYTWADYRTWPDDRRWEIVGGEALAMSPSPGFRHQIVQAKLVRRLDEFLDGKPCVAVPAPMDVKLSDTDIVQPDVLVVCNPGQIKRTHVEGAPALVVEILSESSAQHDRTTKMRLYARHGVPEVWLVTPYPSMIEVYRLAGKAYSLVVTYAPPATLASPGFPKLRLKLKDVFDFPLEPDEEEAMRVREIPPPYRAKRAGRRK